MESPSASDPQSPAQILREHGLDARRSLGQHFLHDRNVVSRIIELADLAPDDTVIEIGPGLGILTAELSRAAGRVVAIEKDATLIDILRSRTGNNVEILEADALEFDYASLVGSRYKVVANLPYNVGTRIIRTLLESTPPPTSMTVMVQREVAERIVAQAPDMNLLSLSVHFYGDPRIGFRVGRGAFTPPPNVDSSVIRIDTAQPPLPREDHQPFFELARTAFQTRRKQLAGPVAAHTGQSKPAVRKLLQHEGVSPSARPEELGLEQWIALFISLKERH